MTEPVQKTKKIFEKIISGSDVVVSTIILATIIVLIIYMVFRLAGVYIDILQFTTQEVLHELAFLVVFVKAYRLMIFYLQSHHVSIKYIMEISIIAPAIEIIFATANQALETNILFAVFSVANLMIYLFFYKQLCEADDNCLTDFPKNS